MRCASFIPLIGTLLFVFVQSCDGCQDSAVAYSSIQAGFAHACVLRTDQTVTCWGAGSRQPNRQLHCGQAIAPLGRYRKLSLAGTRSCAIGENGHLKCWGCILPARNLAQDNIPTGRFVSVAVDEFHGCALREDSSIQCWGRDDLGQSSPPPGKFIDITVGESHGCGIRKDHSVTCWGKTGDDAMPPELYFKQISAGDRITCGITMDGFLRCWGVGADMIPIVQSDKVSVGWRPCSLDNTGNITCWNLDPNNPESIMPLDAPLVDVAAGAGFVCGIAENKPVCWRDSRERFVPDFGQASPP